AETVTECEQLYYKATLGISPNGNPCAFEGGDITITTPDGTPHPANPAGGVPCIGGTAGMPDCHFTHAESISVPYTVSPGDVVSGDITATVDYTAERSHTRDAEQAGVPSAHTALANTVE